MKYFFVLLLSCCSCFVCFAQPDSCDTRISLLTCSPGEELYSTFGHTAIRVQAPAAGVDLVFNYGTFEFGPDFYTKFIRGKLLYFLSIENFNEFIYQYQYEGRGITEQILNLSCDEKRKLATALQENAKEQNRNYRYDFLFDNCTTRARDITRNNTTLPLVFKNILPADVPSFRELIHSYLDAGKQPWSKLGIDILLGVKLDKKVSNEQAMFLPDYLMKGFDSASSSGHALVAAKGILLERAQKDPAPVLSPLVVFSILLVLIGVLSFVNSRRASRILGWFDLVFFFLLGLTGFLLLFMWFGTDHLVCRNNYNLLWALPFHLVMAFFVYSRRSWVKKYFRFIAWYSLALALAWFFLPQAMNPALLPIVLLTAIRSWQLSKTKNYAGA